MRLAVLVSLLVAAATCAPPAPPDRAPAPRPGAGDSPRSAPPAAAPSARDRRTPAAIEADLLYRLNHARRDADLRALTVDDELTRLARAHSRAMRDGDFFGHDDPRRGDFARRAEASGLRYSALAENVAFAENYSDPAATLHHYLMDSPGHRDNRMGEGFREIGIGVVKRGEKVWVTELFRTPLAER